MLATTIDTRLVALTLVLAAATGAATQCAKPNATATATNTATATATDAATATVTATATATATDAATATDDAPDAPATKVTLTALPGRAPLLVAYRAKSDRTWQVLDRHDDRYELSAAARYTLVVVCPYDEKSDVITTFELAARDTATLTAPCLTDQRARITVPVRFVDPAENLWVANEFAGVARDSNGNVVDRDTHVSLPAGRHDWITMSSKPLRVHLEHDVLTTPMRRTADIRAGGPVDRIRIHAPGNMFVGVDFVSRGGTEFGGLGPSRVLAAESETWNIVPYAQRRAGDHDLVYGTDILEDQTSVGVTVAVDSPRDVTLKPPTARPTATMNNRGELRWNKAGDPDIVNIYRANEGNGDYPVVWNTHISRRWLDGATSYAPVDPKEIPGWRWPEPVAYAWISWSWTSDAASLPFEPFNPPIGVTYSCVSKTLR